MNNGYLGRGNLERKFCRGQNHLLINDLGVSQVIDQGHGSPSEGLRLRRQGPHQGCMRTPASQVALAGPSHQSPAVVAAACA